MSKNALPYTHNHNGPFEVDILRIIYIVGRAGRYGSKFPVGEVTCLDKKDLPLIHSSLNCPSPILEVF